MKNEVCSGTNGLCSGTGINDGVCFEDRLRSGTKLEEVGSRNSMISLSRNGKSSTLEAISGCDVGSNSRNSGVSVATSGMTMLGVG